MGWRISLKSIFPENLIEPLERVPRDTDLAAVRDHLIRVLRVMKTYVPHPVAVNPQPPANVHGEMLSGAFLFADVKGFTSLYDEIDQSRAMKAASV